MEENFFAILGEQPSKGARSPKLWNHVSKQIGLKCKMIPIDIKKKNFDSSFDKLKLNSKFKGGAVTIPYKERVFKALSKSNIDPITRRIGAVNCLYRNQKGQLCGTNTDGLAAYLILKKYIKKKNKILILGYGGTGKAISAYLYPTYKSKLSITSRSIKSLNQAKKLYKNTLNWKNLNKKINSFDVIINCTSVGFKKKNESPIQEKILERLKSKFIFDVIYDPEKTKLLKCTMKNNKTLNGLQMNLLQAAKSYQVVAKCKNLKKIINHMKKVK